MLNRILEWLCVHFHRRVTRPVNGHYECLTCFRRYQAPWL
jgi:hypothetical protein